MIFLARSKGGRYYFISYNESGLMLVDMVTEKNIEKTIEEFNTEFSMIMVDTSTSTQYVSVSPNFTKED